MEHFGAVFKLDLTEETRTQLQEQEAITSSCLTLATAMFARKLKHAVTYRCRQTNAFSRFSLFHPCYEVLVDPHKEIVVVVVKYLYLELVTVERID